MAMPFAIVRNDITAMEVDAVVNTANPRPVIGSGVDGAIHQAAGPELLTAREKIGRIGVGEAAITPGFHLRARYVIHTVGPIWQGGWAGEARLLLCLCPITNLLTFIWYEKNLERVAMISDLIYLPFKVL